MNGKTLRAFETRPLVAAFCVATSIILLSFVCNVALAHAATLTTDKPDYAPGETATIYGAQFEPQQDVVMTVVGQNDGTTVTSLSWDVTADDTGSFMTEYTLPDMYIPLYVVAADSTDGTVLAETSFTDAQNLTVAGAGTGTGTITGSGYSCTYNGNSSSGTCVVGFNNNNSVSLTASPTGGSSIGSWSVPTGTHQLTIVSGCTTGSGSCNVKMGTDPVTVTVTFLPPGPKTDQTITVDTVAPGTAVYNATFSVLAHSSSGLDVAITTTGVCSVSTGGTNSASIEMTSGTGTCAVHYNQAGNSSYNPAPEVTSSTTAEKADPVCTITGYTVTYDAASHTATGSCVGVLDETLAGLDLASTTHTNVDTYTDTWTFTDETGNYNNKTDTVSDVINKADPVCTITGYAVLYDGLPHTATGSCVGVLDETLAGLDLSSTTHTLGGAWADPWTFTDVTGNYHNASGTVNDVIIAPQAPITILKKDFQNGSTIPVKFGSTISGWTANLYVCAGDSATVCTPLKDAVSSGGSNVGTLFRYDPIGMQYIYNLSTKLTPVFKGGTTGSKYSLWITVSPILGSTPFKLATIIIK